MSELLETIEDGVATLTMNRPEARNAMGGGMIARYLKRCLDWARTTVCVAWC